VDKYVLLRFAHLIGLMLMSAGLIGVFVADMRSRQVRDVKLLAKAVTRLSRCSTMVLLSLAFIPRLYFWGGDV
jgi:NADH:ubiquinone oxidoreductase subunit 2 (subunit N)